jgi:hypothetical protein
MEDSELKVVGSIRVHASFQKQMGAKTYRMASLDLINDDGTIYDNVLVFCDALNPTHVRFQNYKGQLSVKVE